MYDTNRRKKKKLIDGNNTNILEIFTYHSRFAAAAAEDDVNVLPPLLSRIDTIDCEIDAEAAISVVKSVTDCVLCNK